MAAALLPLLRRQLVVSTRSAGKKAAVLGGGSWFSCLAAAGAPQQASFGIAFDIDGVLLRGDATPIPGAKQALRQLYSNGSQLAVPFALLTNGGGVPEAKRAAVLAKLLDVPLRAEQVILGHTPFREVADRFAQRHVLAVGKHEPKAVLTSYGFRNVDTSEAYHARHPTIWPHFKPAAALQNAEAHDNDAPFEAVFVVSDPTDWGRDLQIVLDVLLSNGRPAETRAYDGRQHVPIFFAADDLEFQAAFATPRLGLGAFHLLVDSVYKRYTGRHLQAKIYGKPRQVAFDYARTALDSISRRPLQRYYMIGDNPLADIRGANEAGVLWTSVLVRTGCFGGADNDKVNPAKQVVADVQEAVDYILRREQLAHNK